MSGAPFASWRELKVGTLSLHDLRQIANTGTGLDAHREAMAMRMRRLGIKVDGE
jgi:hypothetical protein